MSRQFQTDDFSDLSILPQRQFLFQLCLKRILRQILGHIQYQIFVFILRKRHKLNPSPMLVHRSADVPVRTHLCLIRRLKRACVRHFVRNQNPRLVDMPARDIIKSRLRHAPRIPRHVAGISAVCEQQMILHLPLRRHIVQPVFQDLFFIIAASVNRRLLLRHFDALRLRRQQQHHVVRPVEAAVKTLPLHIIVVSGNQHDDRLRDGSKEIINLFQFPQKRLALKQISRNQQKVRLFPSDEADDPPKTLPDGFPALLAPGKSRIRLHAKMHVRNMNKPHRRIPLSGFIFSITTIRTSGAPNPHWIPLHPASVFFKFLYHFS